MNPTEIKNLLNRYGLRLVHDRGQNFLLDDGVIGKIADTADVGPTDRILEIGPGLGVLTEELLSRGAMILAVELDPGLSKAVRERLPSERLDIVNGDFLAQPCAELATRLGVGENDYKVVANLPYSITSDAIMKMLTERPRPRSVTVMVQREVAERATARPPQTGMLSLAVQAYGEPKIAIKVPASSFWPQPKVDSAVLHIKLHSDDEIAHRLGGLSAEKFLTLARLAFSDRRKQLKNTLGRKYPPEQLNAAFSAAQISPQDRPERLKFEQWVSLAQQLMR